MTYEDSLKLFRKGHFRELIDGFKSTGTATRHAEPKLRILFAYVLALTDETSLAATLSNVDHSTLAPSVRSQAETTIGLINWRMGDLDSTWHHLQSGLRWARESGDAERIAWAHLHLFRFAIEAQPLDVLMGLLRDVRAAVVRAAIPYLTAYLHICVSALEGQRGHLDEAWRHCDIAESLLELEPNAWVLGASLVNRGCIACLRCDFKEATEYNRAAVELTRVNGSMRNRAAADITSGHIQMLSGEFEKAQRTLNAALKDPYVRGLRTIGAADSLARVYLALGEFDKCDSTLALVNFSDKQDDTTTNSVYARRWAALTRAKLLIRRGHLDEALSWLYDLETQSSQLGDGPFTAAVHLLIAQTLARAGRTAECADRILRADIAGITRSRDLQGQFYHSVGNIVAGDSTQVGRQLKDRAKRIWSTQGIVAVRSEMGDPSTTLPRNRVDRPTAKDRTQSVVNSLGSIFDIAYSPTLVGNELLNALDALGLSAKARIVETSHADREQPADSSSHVLSLGRGRQGKTVALICDFPRDPLNALVLSDIFRIGRAALALEKAKQEERNRSALWPATPIEEQAGALFIAEDMQTLLTTARRVAAANIPVLITGETGTGKEVIARLIHTYSPRASKTFLPFNCSATPREMLDAQLFGHRKGAFTGATEHFAGVIRAAAGGTLFLDEIGESTLDIQPKLLRFLESGEVHPIGDTHPQRVDVRVLAATNADVDTLVSQGRFREDLFYRLNIVRLHIPPLRDRRVEIPSFANHYLQKYAKESAKGELRLSEETMEYLVLYRWPGNVRQIANEMRRLAALAEPGAVLMPEHLSSDIAASRRTVPPSQRILDDNEIVVRTDQPMTAAVQHLERTMVQSAMSKTSSVDEAAKLLGLSRKGLYLKRLRFGMEIDRPRGEVEVA